MVACCSAAAPCCASNAVVSNIRAIRRCWQNSTTGRTNTEPTTSTNNFDPAAVQQLNSTPTAGCQPVYPSPRRVRSAPAATALSDGRDSWSMMASAMVGATPSIRLTMKPAQRKQTAAAHKSEDSGINLPCTPARSWRPVATITCRDAATAAVAAQILALNNSITVEATALSEVHQVHAKAPPQLRKPHQHADCGPADHFPASRVCSPVEGCTMPAVPPMPSTRCGCLGSTPPMGMRQYSSSSICFTCSAQQQPQHEYDPKYTGQARSLMDKPLKSWKRGHTS